MAKLRNRRWSRRSKSLRLVALEVAEAFCEDLEVSDRKEVGLVQAAAFEIGLSLADAGRPGEWDRIDIAELLSRLPGGEDFGTLVRQIVELLTWLAAIGVLSRRRCLQYLHDIQHHAPADKAMVDELDRARRLLLRRAS